jgi:broad specificity phosphatase PhoE
VLTLLLTRHGHTVRSEPEQYLGQRIDAPLSERGRADALQLAKRLADVEIDRLLSSPLPRAAETAAILAAGRLPVVPDDRLMELDYGAWEGTTVEEIERRHPADYARYVADPSKFRFADGESGGIVARRVRAFIDELLDWWAETTDRTVLVVGHSSLNRIMLAVLLGTPLRDYRRRYQSDWASLTVLRWQTRADGPQLLLGNDLSHLRGTSGVTWD